VFSKWVITILKVAKVSELPFSSCRKIVNCADPAGGLFTAGASAGQVAGGNYATDDAVVFSRSGLQISCAKMENNIVICRCFAVG